MRTILDLVGVKKVSGLYGVEIEVEGENLPTDLDNVWRVEQDGSLKSNEAWEYVMPKPLDLKGVEKSLNYLEESYSSHKSIVYDSVRAGVHVHMNVQNWNIVQLMTFSTCYYLLEDILLNWCGPNREGNLFSLRTRDAEYVLIKIYNALITRNLSHLNTDIIRYSSLNYRSLFKYGSLEFRGMRGTGELKLIMDWVRIIDDIRKSSLTFNNPRSVIMDMSGDGEFEFFKRLLPNTHHLIDFNILGKTLLENARRVQMIAFTVDWDGLGGNNINPFVVYEGF